MKMKIEIDRELIRRAHYWNSMNPDRATEFHLKCLDQESDQLKASLMKHARTQDEITRALEIYGKICTKLSRLYTLAYERKSRTASSMVAGPANFPVESNRKKLQYEQNAWTKAEEYKKRALGRALYVIRPDLAPIKKSDNNAIERTKAKIAELQADQDEMKAVNKFLRKKNLPKEQKTEFLKERGYTDKHIHSLLNPTYSFNREGFQTYELSNNNANLRRYKEKLIGLERLAEMENKEIETDNYNIEFNYDDNRVRIFFTDKPNREARTMLKRNGFKWSPRNKAWQNYINSSSSQFVNHELQNIELY